MRTDGLKLLFFIVCSWLSGFRNCYLLCALFASFTYRDIYLIIIYSVIHSFAQNKILSSSNSQRGAHTTPTGHCNTLVGHAIFWWGMFSDQVNCLLRFLHVNSTKKFWRNPSETSRQIHLPRQQCLINRKGHRHAANEGIYSYQ